MKTMLWASEALVTKNSIGRRWRVAVLSTKLRWRERLEFDSPFVRCVSGWSGILLARVLIAIGRTRAAFGLLAFIHSAACGFRISRAVEQIVRIKIGGSSRTHDSTDHLYRGHSENLVATPLTQKFFDDPTRMLRSMAIVLKSSTVNERGIVCILYSYALPLFARLFDVQRIGRKYFIVIEPSWSGYCNLDILCYCQFEQPVFVQAYEPRDYEFIHELRSNLYPVQISNNWWVDHRVFRPVPDVPKDADVVMIAGWADFKRHYRFFGALRTLRQRGRKIRAILIGYPMGRTKTEILGLAKYYGVDDQLEVYEWISQDQINTLLNRSKVNIIWSRREGVNRAIIEGMFAGVPCIVREGFNYGYSYPYINSSTGCFSSEQELPEKLLWMIENYRQFTPREWVMDNLSCQKATEILNNAVKAKALEAGETWSDGPVVKVNGLHGMSYWDDRDSHRFSKDYEFLTSVIR